jgi:peptidoglycan/LPS O-acetylase OafA/YrhL
MLRGMKRLECLDGLRGLLAVYVLIGHMAPFAMLPGWLQSAVSHGQAAVDVFFILSGLVISQSLSAMHGQPGPFLIARAARLYPVFLAAFAMALAVQPLSCGFETMPWIGADNPARTICVMNGPHAWGAEIAAHLTMTQGLFPQAVLPDVWVSILGSAWSLSTEWQFYLLALLMWGGRGRRLVLLLLAIAVAGLIWRLAVPPAWEFSRAFLGNKGQFFALGVASAGLVGGESRALWRYVAVLGVTLALCATQNSVGKLLPPLVWTLCLAVQMRPEWGLLRPVHRVLRCRAALYLGAISYCVYLVNEPVHRLIGWKLGQMAGGDPVVFDAMWLPLAIGLPLLVSAWLHVRVEQPVLRWGRGFAHGAMRRRVTA